ncbi:MAG: tetratricopeptide repeat protein [Candidatus Dormibacteraeota bacterium]|uniref:Tetratricopeptide repeat protein n=1 Tax=Candidatus Dormiibacter inghamiae TaxID=3127013 RepID=A0A934K7A7_9BACT|nr:tetratricopeptide repeat protein [Candidatus Dormibacteraeota bacterium]MBJ7605926.1 tetratricopeptide repeat protein [Candidatus Dormibacteraeota bacterium]
MSTQTKEPAKSKSVFVDQAVQCAVDARWEEAADLNRELVDAYGPDESAYNRLGKALTELGKLKDAREAYESALKLNPMNPVARKNAEKLKGLMSAKQALKGGTVKVDLSLFVEEMGKTVVTTLKAAAGDVCSKVVPGDVAELRVEGDGVEVDTVRGVRVGSLEAKLARRLLKFIQGGNRYQVGIMSCDGSTVKVILRETYQDPKFMGKPSFPMVRKRETEFRPYTRESLINRDADAFVLDDEESDDLVAGSEAELEEDEGMHEVVDDDDDAEGEADDEDEE